MPIPTKEELEAKLAEIKSALVGMVTPEAPVKTEVGPRFYKDYDIKWLKSEPEHPDFYLVKEYEEKYGEVK